MALDEHGDGAADGDDDTLDDEFVLFAYNFDIKNFGVVRPSVESGLGQVVNSGDWHGDGPLCELTKEIQLLTFIL